MLKLDGARGLIVALFAEECVRIWESTTGMLLSTIQLVRCSQASTRGLGTRGR